MSAVLPLVRLALLVSFTLAGSLGWAAEKPPLSRFSIANMDRSVNPGDDFYRYANGAWLNAHEIPEDQTSWSPTIELIERNAALVKTILESCQGDRPGRSMVEREIGDFYAAAMNTETIEKLGFDPIRPDLKKIDDLKSMDDLPVLLADFHDRGIEAVFDAGVGPDAKDSSTYTLELTQGGLALPDRDYYIEKQFERERANYRQHLQRMLTLLGDPKNRIEQEIDGILAIETALAKVSRKLEDLSDPIENYHKLTLDEVAKLAPSFQWRTYLKAAHAAATNAADVGQPEFFEGLEEALQKHSLDEWKSYLRWHILTGAAPLLHRAAAEESFSFFGSSLNGQPKIEDRWKRASRRVDEALGEALGQIYVEQHFPEAARERMAELVSNLKAVYRDRLGKVPWMNESTRQQAVAKFDRFGAKIGAPAKFRDYSSIEIRRDDYLGNMQRAAQFESRRELARIGGKVDRSEWQMTPTTVNAYFSPNMNEIVFPAGILQPPFFDSTMDDAVNYGAIGATIGHEMTHGYDNEGRKYDANGNLRDWWTKEDAREFEERAEKLVQQFNGYEPLPGLHVNGKLTLAENIADLGGLSIAYEALEKALAADPSKRKEIDGFSPEQRFFISYAQSWAAKTRDESLRQSLTTDSHSPDAIRGFAPLLSLREFYSAFGIKAGAKLWLPLAKRTVIWNYE